MKGIAFAGAIAAAEKAGVQEWVNLAGTSARSIVSALLVAGYDAAGLQKILATDYARFADYPHRSGVPSKMWLGGLYSAIFRRRGLEYFRCGSREWR